jgi:hypothetical protein
VLATSKSLCEDLFVDSDKPNKKGFTMSIENAILELAGAIRELAASNQKAAVAGSLMTKEQRQAFYGESVRAVAPADPVADLKEAGKTNPELASAAEELEQAVQKVEADAKAEKAAPAPEEISAADTTLDYKIDVKPVLLKVFKAHGQPALKGLLDKFGVPNGDKLSADQLPAVLSEANALLAD